ncbi:MAG TPA: N-acetylmuramoyl-L-alanine amidase [Syntrophales bacterium]|nr:N-acetylmuramoyl-L-alanine amidase [Syntrophales bacterium]
MNLWLVRIILASLVLVICLLPSADAQKAHGKHLVVIDPAHGGKDFGVRLTDKEYEKNITLAVSLLLKKELEKAGDIQVLLTRSSDKDVTSSERKKIIMASRSQVLVSVHVNAGFGKTSTGYELYFPGFKTVSAEQSDSKEILKDMARNKYLNDSVRLAQVIQKNMSSVFPRKGRGLRNASVPIIEGLSMPAVVVELGFATNPDDRKKILDVNTQNAIAHALYQSIKDYF